LKIFKKTYLEIHLRLSAVSGAIEDLYNKSKG
jgi:hypothetical protein